MTPEEQVQHAAEAVSTADTRDEIDRLLDDLEFVYDALRPELKDLASGLIEQLHDKRRAL